MIYLVSIGNPDVEYEYTRHNVGHLVLDWFGDMPNFQKMRSDQFMNNSGRYVSKVAEEHSIPLEHLVVVHDDWAFDVGEYRIQKGKNANSHKGVENIIRLLGTNEFWRLRIGIGQPGAHTEASDFVLETFSKADLKKIEELSISMKIELINKFANVH